MSILGAMIGRTVKYRFWPTGTSRIAAIGYPARSRPGGFMPLCTHPQQFTESGADRSARGSSKAGMGWGSGGRGAGLGGKKSKWVKSYSRMTIEEAEVRLGMTLTPIGVPIEQMVEGKSVLLGKDLIFKIKNKVYEGLVDYLDVAGYPTEAYADFKEANINDIVAFTIYPILALFKHETTRRLHLTREKEIISTDFHTSGMEEFVVLDLISVERKKYVTIVEAKKVSLGEARKQCFLAMRDMRDWNGGGTVYGFITMGDSWRMISFDGEFKITEKIELVFDSMAKDKNRWMTNYSILVDCFNVALSHGAGDLIDLA